MIFTVTYRSKTGAKAETEIEAASRAACVVECKARGIMPVGVREGRSRCAVGVAPKQKLFTLRIYLFVAIAVATAIALWWWFGGRGATALPVEKPVQTKAEKQPKKAHGTPAPRVARKPPEPVRHPQGQDAEGEARRTSGGDGPRVVSVVTNDAGFILTTVEENGKTTIQTDTLHPPVFKNPMHQLIAAAVAGSADSEIAPLPLGPGDESAMREALKVEIKDLPDDTEEIRRMKESVRATKEDIAALLDKGMSVSEIFTEHRELWNENLKIRNEMKAAYQRLLQDGDDAAAAQYLEKVNGSFREMGIPEITSEEMARGGKRKRRKKE